VEREMKLPVASHDELRRRLQELGAERREDDALEENWVLDDEAGTLAGAKSLLRVRRRGERAWLTYKGPASFAAGVKSREEIECGVAEPLVLVEVLERVGMRVVRRYQKRRETWRLDEVEVALDTTPMGRFVELEGPAAELPGLAEALALDPARAVPGSYLDLWREYRVLHPEASEDMLLE
jgi:adenylate cyclase class 2